MAVGSPHVELGGQVGARSSLINESSPLYKSTENELTLSSDWLTTYKSPEGRESPLPQLISSALSAKMPTRATTKPVFFNVCSPNRYRAILSSGRRIIGIPGR